MSSPWTVLPPKAVPLREVWPHEERDFSAWVKSHIEVVSEQVGLTIDPETLDPEVASGAFSADLVGLGTDDTTGDSVKVVIENQLERTDHDHLGKILTYAAHHEADVAIWIAAEARPEHVRAVQWLNDHSELAAWLFTIETVQVGPQQAAPLLRRIVGPSILTATARRVRQEDTLDAQAQYDFWEAVFDRLPARFDDLGMYQRHGPRNGVHVWHAIPNNPARIGWQMWVTANGSWACLRIDAETAVETEHYYRQIVAHQDAVNQAFGDDLKWVSSDSARARQLRWDNPVPGGYRDDPDTWADAADRLVDGMRRLVDATRPYVTNLAPPAEISNGPPVSEDPTDIAPGIGTGPS